MGKSGKKTNKTPPPQFSKSKHLSHVRITEVTVINEVSLEITVRHNLGLYRLFRHYFLILDIYDAV